MNKYKSEKRGYAKQLLTHYIDLALSEENKLQFDSWAEVNSIVDLIIDAAKDEIEQEQKVIYTKE